ncbi:hypothetical protein MVEN_00277500 [Mycena venus]|uniref:F-box domain-containing protein n=1 Tax=Mycena venus TaxID=2733690 RepID=A0A8H7DER8_9AGAR|nr:hypothetical protein MVEN_00277500 [Mycena venus]
MDQHALSLLVDLPLKQFHGRVTQLFDLSAENDFFHRFFAHITHLALLDQSVAHETLSNLSLLPNLTHLSLDSIFVGASLTLLRKCPFLLVFVLIRTRLNFPDIDHHPDGGALAEDPRFVLVVCDLKASLEDWHMGTRSGNDYWSRAEDFVAKRRSGKVDISQYRLD